VSSAELVVWLGDSAGALHATRTRAEKARREERSKFMVRFLCSCPGAVQRTLALPIFTSSGSPSPAGPTMVKRSLFAPDGRTTPEGE
jgi:hypothetical protein